MIWIHWVKTRLKTSSYRSAWRQRVRWPAACWAQMAAEQDVPSCASAHTPALTNALIRTHTRQYNTRRMDACVMLYKSWPAKLRGHLVEQEVAADTTSQTSLVVPGVKSCLISICWGGAGETCPPWADYASQKHSRPNRIISAVEGSIVSGVGVDCSGKSNVGKMRERKKCKAKQKDSAVKRLNKLRD